MNLQFKVCPNDSCGCDGEFEMTDTVCPYCGAELKVVTLGAELED